MAGVGGELAHGRDERAARHVVAVVDWRAGADRGEEFGRAGRAERLRVMAERVRKTGPLPQVWTKAIGSSHWVTFEGACCHCYAR